jgi:type III secretion protein J
MQNQVATQRPVARVLLTILFICLCLPFLTSCESRKTIVNKLTEKEANEILVFLSTKGINAIKIPSPGEAAGGSKEALWDISISEEQATQAMSILNQAGLPRRRGQTLLGIFKETGLVPSEMSERIRYEAGLAEQIASTIRKIDGVLDAEVQLSFPQEDPLNPGKTKGDITASVYVKHSGVLDDPNVHLITKIKRLVTSSVTGLKYDNVTIISDRARFSDFPVGLQAVQDEEKDFVKTWTLIIAKESLFRFRIIFFSFFLISLLLILGFFWIGWKVYPVLQQRGGVSSLFSLTPLVEVPESEEKLKGGEGKEEVEEGAAAAKEEEEEEEGPPSDVT